MRIFLLLAFVATDPNREAIYVDSIEINCLYMPIEKGWRESGRTEFRPSFDQLILYRWDKSLHNHVVAQWALVREYEQSGEPRGECRCEWMQVGDTWRVLLVDKGDKTITRLCTRSFRLTAGTQDPERENRKILPQHLRVPYFGKKGFHGGQ